MKDDWLNLGFLGEELKPYVEPVEVIDEKRIGNYFDIMQNICRNLFLFQKAFVILLDFCMSIVFVVMQK